MTAGRSRSGYARSIAFLSQLFQRLPVAMVKAIAFQNFAGCYDLRHHCFITKGALQVLVDFKAKYARSGITIGIHYYASEYGGSWRTSTAETERGEAQQCQVGSSFSMFCQHGCLQ